MSDTMVTTNRIAMAADGTVWHCTPAGMVPLDAVGPGIQYGAPLALNRGDPLPAGFWQVLEGGVSADLGGATVRQLIIGG